jgi:hypothetical protein
MKNDVPGSATAACKCSGHADVDIMSYASRFSAGERRSTGDSLDHAFEDTLSGNVSFHCAIIFQQHGIQLQHGICSQNTTHFQAIELNTASTEDP